MGWPTNSKASAQKRKQPIEQRDNLQKKIFVHLIPEKGLVNIQYL